MAPAQSPARPLPSPAEKFDDDQPAIGVPMSKPANPVTLPLADYSPRHFLLAVVDGVATVTLNRPEGKNPLTFESYRELTDFFRACAFDDQVKRDRKSTRLN